MRTLGSLVLLLLDGEWHTYEKVAEKTGMTEVQPGSLLRLLSEFGMADVDEEGGRCRLEPLTCSVWAELVRGERA